MIKVKGIGNVDLTWDYKTPPKTFRKVSSSVDADGNFSVEVYKLKSFNKVTKEALYVKCKNEKAKALTPLNNHLNLTSFKKRFNSEEEEF